MEERWTSLIHTLNGYFCTSLAHAVSKNTAQLASNERLAMLSGETVCTENLTPLVKMLPCKKSGLVALLDAEWLVASAHYHALSVNMQCVACVLNQQCSYDESMAYKATLGVSVVHRVNERKPYGINAACKMF